MKANKDSDYQVEAADAYKDMVLGLPGFSIEHIDSGSMMETHELVSAYISELCVHGATEKQLDNAFACMFLDDQDYHFDWDSDW